MSQEFLWYIPNQVDPGHRGDDVVEGHNSLATLTEQALALEEHGWGGALIGTGWGRPDTFTVATALAARTTTFRPLIAVRPGYWRPANFATAAATLHHLTGGRALINIVSGRDNLAAYGDAEGDQPQRYARTKEFLQLVRRLWTEENVTFEGEHFRVEDSTVVPRLTGGTPRLYFGGASEAAERVAATEADVQLFWGEPLDGVADRIARLKRLSAELGREHAPLEFGLRITTLIRDTTDQAWSDAETKVAAMAPTTPPTRSAAARWASSASSTSSPAARSSTTTSTPPRANSAPAAPAPPGWSAPPRRSPSPCASTATWASPTSSSPTPLTSPS
ncbi:LLM class flavin-dependent oxidoreductase [Actinoplanes sp. NPDC051851]|uniref:LLM class flavin-dependent oxidoreductase n=1 Tax=Actinoplanes sp. NPDC051851 TaxID=3154753 RepID=UPI003416B914